MSDQQAPQNGDTPAVAGPEQAPGTAQEQQGTVDPYEKRYNDLRPQFDRTTQRLSELEQAQQYYELALTAEDEDTRRQALEALGYDVPEDEDVEPAEYEDPYETLAQRTERLEQRYEESQRNAQQQAEGELINEITRERLNALGIVEEGDQDLVLGYAINALPPVRQPPGSPVSILPDVDQAVEFFQAREAERQKAWAKTKRAPYVPPGGVPANEVTLPLDAPSDQRVAFAMQKMQEREGAE